MVHRLRDSLKVYRIHQSQCEWRNIIRNFDTIISDPYLHIVIFTDFGATLDLLATEKLTALLIAPKLFEYILW